MDKLLDLTRDFNAAKAAFEAYLDEYDSCKSCILHVV